MQVQGKAESVDANRPAAGASMVQPRRRKDWQWVFSLAMVVGVLVFVGLQYRWNYTVQWGAPMIERPQFRGADGTEMPARYTEADVQQLLAALQEKVTQGCADAIPRQRRLSLFKPQAQWVMETQFSELRNGAFTLTVKSHDGRSAQALGEWSGTFQSPDEYRAEMARFSHEIAAGLITAGTRQL